MSELLAPGGALAEALPDYEDRPEQRAMAEAVARALATGRSLLVEAGTGTGKTFAYLVPALASGLRVVVSTGTRTLQEQIARHDLPRLESMLGRRLEAVTLKGVGNYLCRRRFHELLAEPDGAVDDDLAKIIEWARSTASGDRAELTAVADRAPIWQKVTTSPESRLGARCPHAERCFVSSARKAAERADLILVNHHLFFADLALRAAHPGAKVLPEHDAVIFDEAHQLEDVITEHMGIQVSTGRLAAWLRDVEASLAPGEPLLVSRSSRGFVDGAARCANELMRRLGARIAERAADGDRVELPPDTFGGEVEEAWLALDTALDEAGAHLEATASETNPDAGEPLRGLARRAERIRDDMATLAEGSEGDLLTWGETRADAVTVRASPIAVDRVLREHVAGAKPVVMTSATLRTAGRFDYARERLGLDEDLADELALAAPFDYATQALLYIARDLPAPREPDFPAAAAARVAELVAITSGRAFVLFTTHRVLADVSARLAKLVDYPLMVQGKRSRAGLLDDFRRTEGAVLCATGGFWEGVDIPGEALSQVIIDKLPFAPPTDPLVGARMKRIEDGGGDPFARYQLPQAALALQQGFGRLIRRRGDRGLLGILDNRIVTRRYGQVFVDSLPSALPRTSSIERARRWWSAA